MIKTKGDKGKDKATKALTTPKKKEEIYVGRFEHIFNRQYTDNDIKKLADDLYEWFDNPEHFKISEFLTQPDKMIARSTIIEFTKKNPYFARVYEQVKKLQEERLTNFMIASEKPTAWIFAMKNMAGWRDNPEQIQDDDGSDMSLSFDGWK